MDFFFNFKHMLMSFNMNLMFICFSGIKKGTPWSKMSGVGLFDSLKL